MGAVEGVDEHPTRPPQRQMTLDVGLDPVAVHRDFDTERRSAFSDREVDLPSGHPIARGDTMTEAGQC